MSDGIEIEKCVWNNEEMSVGLYVGVEVGIFLGLFVGITGIISGIIWWYWSRTIGRG